MTENGYFLNTGKYLFSLNQSLYGYSYFISYVLVASLIGLKMVQSNSFLTLIYSRLKILKKYCYVTFYVPGPNQGNNTGGNQQEFHQQQQMMFGGQQQGGSSQQQGNFQQRF